MGYKFYKSKEFRALNDEWYKRLRKSGFDDHEIGGDYSDVHDNSYLKYAHQNLRYNMSENEFKLRLTYHYNLRKFSFDDQFASILSLFLPKLDQNSIILTENHDILIDMLRKITYLYGDGRSVAYISRYLRRYYAQPPNKPGRGGRAFSTYWVHAKLKIIKIGLTRYVAQEEKLDE